MKNIIITGGTGLVGSEILINLFEKKYKIYLATSNKKIVTNNSKKIEIIKYNIKDKKLSENFIKKLKKCDCLIHCAVIKNKNLDSFINNIKSTLILCESIKKYKVKKFINISATNLFPKNYNKLIQENSSTNPENLYVLSKYLSELIANFYNNKSLTEFYNLRISAPFGNIICGNAVIPIFLKNASKNLDLVLSQNGEEKQVFTYTKDISRICLKIIELKKNLSGTFNITNDKSTKIYNLASLIIRKTKNSKSKIILKKKNDDLILNKKIDISKARKILKFKPTKLSVAIEYIVNNKSNNKSFIENLQRKKILK